ncbi:cell division protein FtsQ/DivIB [Dysosmobacter sp.]
MAKRRHSNRRHRRGSFGFLYKVLSMLVICGAVVAALTLFFRVDTIVVTGEERYTEAEVVSATGVATGDNLFLLNKFAVANSILAELPYIEEIRINRKLPDTLLIDVKECGTPLAVIQDGIAWLVSPGGKIVEQRPAAEAGETSLISGCTLLAPSVGSQLALATEYAGEQQSLLALLSALEDAALLDQVDGIRLGDLSSLVMEYGGRFSVELPYGADYPRKLRALQKVIESLESNQTGTIQMTWDSGEVHFIEN